MSKLDAAQRNALPASDFAGPGRSFPIEDETHARAALSMAHYASDPAAIRAAVHQKFPAIGGQSVKARVIAKLKGEAGS